MVQGERVPKKRPDLRAKDGANHEVFHFQSGNAGAKAPLPKSNFSFTVNVGVYSAILGPPKEFPREPQCHYRERLGFLMPAGADTWWLIDTSPPTSGYGSGGNALYETEIFARHGGTLRPLKIRVLGEELGDALERYALPRLERLATDEGLLAYWLGLDPSDLSAIEQEYLYWLRKKVGNPRVESS